MQFVHHLQAIGLHADTASDGLQAIHAVKQYPQYAVVFMDLCMVRLLDMIVIGRLATSIVWIARNEWCESHDAAATNGLQKPNHCIDRFKLGMNRLLIAAPLVVCVSSQQHG